MIISNTWPLFTSCNINCLVGRICPILKNEIARISCLDDTWKRWCFVLQTARRLKHFQNWFDYPGQIVDFNIFPKLGSYYLIYNDIWKCWQIITDLYIFTIIFVKSIDTFNTSSWFNLFVSAIVFKVTWGNCMNTVVLIFKNIISITSSSSYLCRC